MIETALAYDLGGTGLGAALVTRDGVVRRSLTVPTRARDGVEAVLSQMVEAGEELRSQDPGARVIGVGVGAPGPLNPATGIMIAPPTLDGWQNVPLTDLLSARTGLPVALENDANVAAFGEWRLGAGRGFGTVLYVTVSTGIGGGVISDGRIFHGSRGLALEIGHMAISDTGPRCVCGAVGCFEALASGTALGRNWAEAKADGTTVAGPENGRPGARMVIEAARAGDVTARRLVDQEAYWLGVGFTSLLHIFSPDVIVVGGGLSNAFDMLIGGIREVVADRAMSAYRDIPIRRAELGQNAGLVGAGALVFGTDMPPVSNPATAQSPTPDYA